MVTALYGYDWVAICSCGLYTDYFLYGKYPQRHSGWDTSKAFGLSYREIKLTNSRVKTSKFMSITITSDLRFVVASRLTFSATRRWKTPRLNHECLFDSTTSV